MFRMRSASTSIHENRNAVSVISHTHFTAYCIVAGYSAHSHADHSATLRLKQRAAISQVVHTISAFNTQSNARIIHAASAV